MFVFLHFAKRFESGCVSNLAMRLQGVTGVISHNATWNSFNMWWVRKGVVDLMASHEPLGSSFALLLEKFGITAQTAAACDWNCNHLLLQTESSLFHSVSSQTPTSSFSSLQFLICLLSSFHVCFSHSARRCKLSTCDPLREVAYKTQAPEISTGFTPQLKVSFSEFVLTADFWFGTICMYKWPRCEINVLPNTLKKQTNTYTGPKCTTQASASDGNNMEVNNNNHNNNNNNEYCQLF